MKGIHLTRWGRIGDTAPDSPAFLLDLGEAPEHFAGWQVVSPRADVGRIDDLLAAGAQAVLVGEAALRDGGLIAAAVARHGPERIGVWLPVRLAQTNWSLDRESNADFSFVSIGVPVPRWRVLRADGSLTDVDAQWWAGEMLKAGSARVLLSVAEPRDEDLLPCAEMVEAVGERLWLDTGSAEVAELRFWVKYGQARRLVLPPQSDLDQAMVGLDALLSPQGTPA